MISEAFHSGSGRYLQQLANALADVQPVTVISPPHESEAQFSAAVRRRFLRSIQSVRPAALKALAMQYQTLGRMAQAFSARRAASAYLVLFPGKIVFALQLLIFLRLLGRRVVLNVHDVRPHARHLPFLPSRVEDWLFKLYYRLPHGIVVLTEAAADEMRRLHDVPAAKVTVVPHGDFALSGGPLPCPTNGRRFLIFGALRANKAVLDSVSAFQSLRRTDPTVSLVIAGQAHKEESAYWLACKRQIAAAPEGIDLREGYVAEAALPALFRDCSALLLPYRDFTSQSGVAVMGVLSGRPIVASPVGGIAELFALGDIGVAIAPPVAAESIAAALRQFMSAPIAQHYDAAVQVAKSLTGSLSWPSVAAGFRGALTGAR